MTATEFRFLPRYRAYAWTAIALGVATAVAALVGGARGRALWTAVGFGGGAAALAALYLRSPVWRYRLRVDDRGVELVDHHGDRRFLVEWTDVVRCVASPDTRTLALDGGGPERTVVVPGPGAPAPYDVADKDELYEAIVRRVPPERIERVDLVELARR
ncbi:MAG: hypothetical protein D6689_14925 [Deltaproteobacteria bacterium]|nr:MAG: hypothetical protein D6689_14925 [Deltaproteobacteria bacterium]